ncbi:hypothetical protein HDU92_001407 [Lobulomyces angularis]|nr:hypothetical protein HDU92_001407 [Lobulomyces angularis]
MVKEALLNEFEKFINHTVPLCNLPLPKIFQKKLQGVILKIVPSLIFFLEYTLETIKNWYEKFGNHYKQLAAGCNYIVNELKIKFLNNHGIHFQLSNEQFVKSVGY